MSAIAIFPEPLLRDMRFEDTTAVTVVEKAAYEYPWTLAIFRDCLRVGYQCRVWETPAGIVGHGVMSLGPGECHILNVCVHPDHQRCGLGRRMVEHLLELARGQGARVALLEVRTSNDAAYRLYQALGFDEVGVRKNYYPARKGREDALILARDLGV